MNILKQNVKTELNVKGSRFISELFACDSQNEARQILKQQKEKYQDATHVCHAFVIGKACEVLGMSDDGEPGGTAGRPMLDVLKGCGITNIMLTVTRYFGGTLLGTGLLTRTYAQVSEKVVKSANLITLAYMRRTVRKKRFYIQRFIPALRSYKTSDKRL